MLTDLKYLQQMTGNDSEIMKEMIDLFLKQLSEMRVDVDFFVESENWLDLSRLAHKIKSSSLVMGAVRMSEEMKELELMSKEGKDTEKYPEYIARLHTMIDIVEMELRPYLSDN